jgi:hypothetical protein
MRMLEPKRNETMSIRMMSGTKDYITKTAAKFKISPSGAVNQILEDWVKADKKKRKAKK